MALPLVNNLNGGTHGTTVSTANSGGTCGDAFDTVTPGAGQTLTFDNTKPAHGEGLGFKLVTAAPAVAGYVEWGASLGTLGVNQTLAGRFYIVFPVVPPFSSLRLIRILNGTTLLCGLNLASGTGKLVIRNSADVDSGAGGTSPTAGTLSRVEFKFTDIGSATLGACTARFFLGDGTAAQGTDASGTGLNFGTLRADNDRVDGGVDDRRRVRYLEPGHDAG